MTIQAATTPRIGDDVARVDAHAKVTGQARYGSDIAVQNPVFAVLVTSSVARGRISNIDAGSARRQPGVLEVITHATVGDAIKPTKFFAAGGYVGSSIMPLASDRVWHAGQIVAVVLGETFEQASEGAARVKVTYDAEPPAATFDSAGAETVLGSAASKTHSDPEVGDAAAAFAAAPVKVDARCATPAQHHNPMELFTTTCAWDGDRLTVWEPTQNVYGIRFGLADQLGIDPDDVHVISPYVGGAFGARGSLTQRTAIIAFAARRVGRPVKLVATRAQGFTIATYRAETRHHIRLGATPDGRLQSLTHEAWEVTSRPDPYMVAGTDATTRLYACPNVASRVSIVHADRNTPGFMRAPAEVPYMFALESAMDELAVALKMDPIALRRVNDTMKGSIGGLPYTSRALMKCFDAGAAAFGWDKRDPKPGSMQDGDWLVGLGCATTLYPTQISPAAARVTLTPQGRVLVQTAAHDVGTGAYTVVALTVADRLGVPMDAITVALGDSDLPPAPVAGGSNTTASVCNVVAKACDEIVRRIAQSATAAPGGPFAGADPATLVLADATLRDPEGRSEALQTAIARASNGAIEAYAENVPEGAKPDAMQKLARGIQGIVGGSKLPDRLEFAFGAEFVEVRVHKETREIRCPRILGAFAAGRIVSPRTAESQLMGGLIWGVSSALHEATEIDQRTARTTNDNLADYLIPVNADIGEVKVIMLPEEDTQVNPLGIKGVGELGIVGANAAVANAVFHATGVRVRELPIRVEDLLAAG
jgi:xanthine dehydrogenase YagR molybdenum-binding subunit